MQSIRKRLSIILVCTSILVLFIATLLVNIAISRTFDKYLVEIQNKRNTRIVKYLEEVYKRTNKWNETSGIEIMHEAYMSNYCLTLKDENKKIVWGMNPKDVAQDPNVNMHVKNEGIYTTSTFQIKPVDKVVGYVEIGQYAPVILSQEDVNFKVSINESIILRVRINIYFECLSTINKFKIGINNF